MKNLCSFFIASFFFFAANAQGDQHGGGLLYASVTVSQTGGSLDDVIAALRSGNAAELGKHIDANLEISLPSKTDNYSRQQAVQILQDFFSNNGVKNFESKHRGDNGGSQYCIGTLLTRSGNFRTTVFMTDKGGKQFVKEIRFQTM